jgi:hypothetical protein
MNSETVARVLGTIVGAAALIMAFMYAPPGRMGKPEKLEPPQAQPVPPPVVRGPVVREVPQ